MLGFAAIAAIGGAVSTALTTGFSIGDMRRMRKLQKESDADALKFRQEADKFLEVNVYDQLGIQMKPYELEREALASVGAQSIEAGRESERGAAAVAGRVYAGYSDAIRDIQTRQGQEMADLEKLSAAEDSRLRDIKTQLVLDEAEGAQMASAMYDERAQQAKANAIAGGISMIGQAAKLAPLYGTDVKSEQAAFGQMNLNADQLQKLGPINFASLGTADANAMAPFATSNFDPQMISQFSKPEYKAFVKSLTPDQYQMLFGSKQFGDLYNQAASANQFNPFGF
jgi:hypothetical protein